jgi:hypothetical protein
VLREYKSPTKELVEEPTLLLSSYPTQHMKNESMKTKKKKLKVMIISMGGERQEHMKQMFAQHDLSEDFEAPVFVPGVPARHLRNRQQFLRYAAEAGLLPPAEWQALQQQQEQQQRENEELQGGDGNADASINSTRSSDNHLRRRRQSTNPSERFFDCLHDIPVTENRRGSQEDISNHYSIELWRKAKAINRGRAVLACVLAHLIAWKRFTQNDDNEFDLLMEDNARVPCRHAATRICEAAKASAAWEQTKNSCKTCHLRYLGWLGSRPNLEWIYSVHIPRRKFPNLNLEIQKKYDERDDISKLTIVSFPTTQEIEQDLLEKEEKVERLAAEQTESFSFSSSNTSTTNTDDDPEESSKSHHHHKKPGGTPVWGSYGYWISQQAYIAILDVLRHDVGALLWKGKRARYYSVKPIDKILPRQIMSIFGAESVHLTTMPALFRAPMLTSKIHAKWDPEFCCSTTYQLLQAGLQWSDLWLTSAEQKVVQYYEECGEWLTLAQLEERI